MRSLARAVNVVSNLRFVELFLVIAVIVTMHISTYLLNCRLSPYLSCLISVDHFVFSEFRRMVLQIDRHGQCHGPIDAWH